MTLALKAYILANLLKLSDLDDVSLASPADGQSLVYDAATGKWKSAAVGGGGGPTLLNDLTDVSIATPAANQLLKYNGTNWVNALAKLSELSDISLASLSASDVLKYNGTSWVNAKANLSELGDVTVSSPTGGQVLTYDGATGKWIAQSPSSGVQKLNDLSDVNVSTPTSGQVLQYNGTNWVNGGISSATYPNTYDPRDYGASTTATRTTNRDAIQAAIDAAGNAGGGVVNIYEWYPVTSTVGANRPSWQKAGIGIPNGVIVRGVGDNSGLEFDGLDNTICVQIQPSSNANERGIEHLKIFGKSASHTSHNQIGILIGEDPFVSWASDKTFLNDVMVKFIGIGIKISNPAQGIVLNNINLHYVTNIGLWLSGYAASPNKSNPGNTHINYIFVRFEATDTTASNLATNPTGILIDKMGDGNPWERVTIIGAHLYLGGSLVNNASVLDGMRGIRVETDPANPAEWGITDGVTFIGTNFERMHTAVSLDDSNKLVMLTFIDSAFVTCGYGVKTDGVNTTNKFINWNGISSKYSFGWKTTYHRDTGVQDNPRYTMFEDINKINVQFYGEMTARGSGYSFWKDASNNYYTKPHHANIISDMWFLEHLTNTQTIMKHSTRNSGKSTFSGDGIITQFTIPHNMVITPTKVYVTAGSTDAKGDFYVTADATNIIVTYATAPPTGTNNVVLYWSAEV